MTTSITSYAALLRRELPGTQVPSSAVEGFFKADQQLIATLQTKINMALAIPQVRALFQGPNGEQFQNLEVNGRFGDREYAFLMRMNQILPQLDAVRAPSGRGGTAIAPGSVADLRNSINTLREVAEFHVSPASDYHRIKTENPVMGLKIMLQQSDLTRSGTNNNTYLVINNNVNDWQFALATRKLAHGFQTTLNNYCELTGVPPMATSGENLPEMRLAMQRLLANPEAREKIGPGFDDLKARWTTYSRLTPEQHATMEKSLESAARQFINIYNKAQDEQYRQNGPGSSDRTLPDIQPATNPVYGTHEQGQLRTLKKFIEGYNADSIRQILDKNNNHEWLGMGDSKYDVISKADMDFAIYTRGHMMEYLALKQAGYDKRPVQTPRNADETKIYQFQQLMMTDANKIGTPTTEIPTIFGIPITRGAVNGQSNDMILSNNVMRTVSAAHQLAILNMGDPAFAKHIMTQTAMSLNDLRNLKAGSLDQNSIKLIRAVASYPGLATIEGINPSTTKAIQMIAGFSDQQITSIRDNPIRQFQSSVVALNTVFGGNLKVEGPASMTAALAENYAANLGTYQTLIKSKAQIFANLADEATLQKLPADAQAIIRGLSAALQEVNPGDSVKQNLFNYFKQIDQTQDGGRTLLSGNENDPIVRVAKIVLSLKGAKDANGATIIADTDPLMRASASIDGINRGIGFMTLSQKIDFNRALTAHHIRSTEPALLDFKKFINDNLQAINDALPADKKIPHAIPLNNNYRDPDFLRAFNALNSHADPAKLATLSEDISRHMQKIRKLEVFITGHAIALETAGQPVRFSSDLQAADSAGLITAKRALADLSGNTMFTGVPAYKASIGLLDPKEDTFIAAIDYVRQNTERWIRGVPVSVYRAAAMSPAEIIDILNARRLQLPEAQRAGLEMEIAFRSLGRVSELAQFTAEEFKALPAGAVTVPASGRIVIDPSKLDISMIDTLNTILRAKMDTAPPEMREKLNLDLATIAANAGNEIGIISEYELARAALFVGQLPTHKRLSTLAAGANDPGFAARLTEIPAGMTREAYAETLRKGLTGLAQIEALQDNPDMMAKIDIGLADRQKRITAQAASPSQPAEAEQGSGAPNLTNTFAGSDPFAAQLAAMRAREQAEEIIKKQRENAASVGGREVAPSAEVGGATPGAIPVRRN